MPRGSNTLIAVGITGLLLSGCGAATENGSPDSGSDTNTASQPSTATATSTPTATNSGQQVAATAFTTADGLYTFQLPESWEAVPVEAPTLPDSDLSTTGYAIQNEDGTEVVQFSGGFYGDGAAGPPVKHKVLDAAILKNVKTTEGDPVHFVFESYAPAADMPMQFNATIGAGPAPKDGTYPAALGQVPIGDNGYTIFRASRPADFLTAEEGHAWTETEEYVKLRAMLTSLTFNG